MRNRHLILKWIFLRPLSKENIRFTLVKLKQDLSGIKIELHVKTTLTFPWTKLNFLFKGKKKKGKVSIEL